MIAVTALSTTGIMAYTDPSSRNLAFFILVILLTPLSGFNHAKKFLVALNDPRHAAIGTLDWPAEQLVLGHTTEDRGAIAWTLEMLRPHHLINDWLGGEPVLAGW